MAVHKNRNSGFTLLETLLTVAVLVILLGLSIVGVARYRDHLKITELDNAARDIYMAAENRAVLLQNSGAAVSLLSSSPAGVIHPPEDVDVTLADGTTKKFRMLSQETDILDALLPVGVIDPTLREGHFYILYDKITFHVYEVFYAEGEIDESKLDNFRKTRGERVSEFRSKKTDRLVGHYLGGPADYIGAKPMPLPGVQVLITNKDELTLTVTYTIPSDAPVGMGIIPEVTLTYGTHKVVLLSDLVLFNDDERLREGKPLNDLLHANPGDTVKYTWVLDSLEQDTTRKAYTKQFRDLFSGTTPDLGDEFTVNASLKLTAEGYIESDFHADGKDNSLFAKDSTYGSDGTAQIENLRHLQNLHHDHSNVGDGTVNAKQIADIDCEESKKNGWETAADDKKKDYILNENYEFIPIENNNLTSYDGQDNHIHSLSTKEVDDAGLFGKVSNTLKIENTRVCWKDSDHNKLVSDDFKTIAYKVSGTNAGGLIGSVSSTGDVTITNSFAATTVEGANNAGGLIGSVGTGGKVTIEKSYADCYLKATGSNTKVGGLVGSGTVNKLENCYAAGFIVEPPENAKTAGLVNGSVNASNTYSVVRVIKTDSEDKTKLGQPEYPLYVKAGGTEPAEDDKTNHVYYLYRAGEIKASDFVGGAFEDVEKENTHPYDLRHRLDSDIEELKDKTYPFPGIKNLPHYCDWAELDATELVYYEIYETNTLSERYGMATVYKDDSSGHKKGDTLSILLKDDIENPVVTKDGYALAFKEGTKLDVKKGYTVEYGTGNSKQTWTLTKVSAVDTDIDVAVESVDSWKWEEKDGNGDAIPGKTQTGVKSFEIDDTGANNTTDTKYVLIPLPDEVVTGNLAKEDKFYQQIVCGEDEKTFFFNPHFAKTVKVPEKDDNGNDKKDANGNVIPPDEPTVDNFNKNQNKPDYTNYAYIRTPRHLYDLSRTYTYSSGTENYYHKGYYFKQELDLDYSTYEGYTSIGTNIDKFAPKSDNTFRKQAPIGSQSNPFRGTYDGGCHIIKNVFFKPNGTNLGLFGVTESGYTSNIPNSKLVNVVYEMNPATTGFETVTKADANVGALLGQNNCEVTNCAVFGVNMEVTATNIGGLVGQNNGTITNCAAEVASLTVKSGIAGGLVGQNNGANSKVENSYAIGKITRSEGTGIIAGLVADNNGIVNTSYAAVDLVDQVNIGKRYGLCAGSKAANIDNSGWLKDVFVYRGQKYNITATSDYIDSNYADTFTGLQGKLKTQSKADYTVRNVPSGADYASAYKGSFPYLTGVKTTLTRNTDGGITSEVTTKQSIHYGLWPAPLPVGLVYYETDSSETYVSGQYEELPLYTLKTNGELKVASLSVTKDGYALVFEGKNDEIPHGEYKVDYGNNNNVQNWTLKKEKSVYKWIDAGGEETDTVTPIEIKQGTVDYTLIPLPDSVVTGPLPEGDIQAAKYYQGLVYGPGLYSERTFYFNPHFAKTVKAGSVVNGEYTAPITPSEPRNDFGDLVKDLGITKDAKVKERWEHNAISVRTARHFYALSHFQNSYIAEYKANPDLYAENKDDFGFKRYFFQQELDVDYNTYAWYGNSKPTPAGNYYKQDPIGIGWRLEYVKKDDYYYPWTDDGFKGAYDGGGYTIRNVFYDSTFADTISRPEYDEYYNKGTLSNGADRYKYDMNRYQENKRLYLRSQFMGLFRYAEYLWNINYEVPDVPGGIDISLPNDKVNLLPDPSNPSHENSNMDDGVKAGTLAGGVFRIMNCSVTMGSLTFESSKKVYLGGMFGYANTARDCSVTINGCLKFTGTDSETEINIGGLQGLAFQESRNFAARVNSLVVDGTIGNCYAGGLIGCTADSGRRTIAYNSVEIKDLRVTGSGDVYAGGLIGHSSGDTGSNWGNICSSFAVGAIGANDTDADHHYGGFVGLNENVKKTGGGKIENCYSAVGVPNTTGSNFCAKNSGTIAGCYYLSGSWLYGGNMYTALEGGFGTGKTYDELANLDALKNYSKVVPIVGVGSDGNLSISGMGKATNNAYPFLSGTKRNGAYFSPATDWPTNWTDASASTVSEASEPEDETLAPEAEPIAPDTEPEPGEEESAEEAESEIEPAA